MTTKATLYLDSDMYKTLKMRAVDTGHTISELMNEALQAQLTEDMQDIKSIRTRLSHTSKSLSYETALEELKNSGII